MGAVASVVGSVKAPNTAIVCCDVEDRPHMAAPSKQPRNSNITMSTQSSHSTPNQSQHRLSNTTLPALSSSALGISNKGGGADYGTNTSETSPIATSTEVDMYALKVPMYERHPFQDYTFGKKLGE